MIAVEIADHDSQQRRPTADHMYRICCGEPDVEDRRLTPIQRDVVVLAVAVEVDCETLVRGRGA
jgi:hypothetical protein